MIDFLNNFW